MIAQVIGPGWRIFGKTYEEWAALPAGPYEIPEGSGDDDHPGPPPWPGYPGTPAPA